MAKLISSVLLVFVAGCASWRADPPRPEGAPCPEFAANVAAVRQDVGGGISACVPVEWSHGVLRPAILSRKQLTDGVTGGTGGAIGLASSWGDPRNPLYGPTPSGRVLLSATDEIVGGGIARVIVVRRPSGGGHSPVGPNWLAMPDGANEGEGRTWEPLRPAGVSATVAWNDRILSIRVDSSDEPAATTLALAIARSASRPRN